MIDPGFVLVGVAIQLGAAAYYVAGTVSGRVIPHRVSWLLWAVAPLVAFPAQLSEGVGIQSLFTLMLGVIPMSVLAASFLSRRAGTWAITRFDLACGGLSILGLVLWQVTGRGNVAIAMSLAGDAFAGVPTLRKAVIAPHTETYVTYLAAAVTGLITLLTVDHWTFAEAAWPAYILTFGSVLAAVVRFPRRQLDQQSTA